MKEFMIEATDGPSIEFDGKLLAAMESEYCGYVLAREIWETDTGRYVLVRRGGWSAVSMDWTEAKLTDNPLADIDFFKKYAQAHRLLRLAGFEEVVTV